MFAMHAPAHAGERADAGAEDFPDIRTRTRSIRMAGTNQGIIEPPIDSLLEKVDSKYQLVIYAAKRARQINDYYSDLHEGNLFDNVGPLVDSTVEDKPLTIALHEIHEAVGHDGGLVTRIHVENGETQVYFAGGEGKGEQLQKRLGAAAPKEVRESEAHRVG